MLLPLVCVSTDSDFTTLEAAENVAAIDVDECQVLTFRHQIVFTAIRMFHFVKRQHILTCLLIQQLILYIFQEKEIQLEV